MKKHTLKTIYAVTIFSLALSVFLTTAIAKEKKKFKVPHDAVIKVYSKDGKLLGTMSRKNYKVVKLGTSKVKVVEKVKVVVRKKKPSRKLGLLLGGGVGKDGLKIKKGSDWEVSEKDKAVGTLGACVLNPNQSAFCGTVSTNKTIGVQVVIPVGK